MFVEGNLVKCKTSGVIGYVTKIYSRQYPHTINNTIKESNWGAIHYRIETYTPVPNELQIRIIDIETGKDYHAPYDQWEHCKDVEGEL